MCFTLGVNFWAESKHPPGTHPSILASLSFGDKFHSLFMTKQFQKCKIHHQTGTAYLQPAD